MLEATEIVQEFVRAAAQLASTTSKSMRFGTKDIRTTDPNTIVTEGESNRDKLVTEMNQLVAVMDMLGEAGIVPADWRSEAVQAKKRAGVLKFMRYAETRGALAVGSTQEFESTK